MQEIVRELGQSHNTVRKSLKPPCRGGTAVWHRPDSDARPVQGLSARSSPDGAPAKLPAKALLLELRELGYRDGSTQLCISRRLLRSVVLPDPVVRSETKPGG